MTQQLSVQGPSAGLRGSPYRGLMPYTEEDAALFFGRESEVRQIVNTAKARRFGVLYGPSGVGKSSVLQAGVVRQIRDENRLRFERFGAVETVVAYLKEWRDDPYAALVEAVRNAFTTMPGATPLPQRSADVGIADEILQLRSERGVDLVLILDQFEEFFLYHRAEAEPLAELLDQLTERGTRVHVLVSLREDALAMLDELEADLPGVFESTLRLEHLDARAAEAAIRSPLDQYNSIRPEAERITIEDDLVRALLAEVRTGRVQVDSTQETVEPVAEVRDSTLIEAPYLQLVLTRLWDEETKRQSKVLRLSTLRELGGAQEIVRQHLDRVMREFSPPEMAVLADAFGHLVTPSGSKIAHRAGDLAGFSGRDPAQMAALLLRLAEGRHLILRELPPPMNEPHAEPRYEIFHDVLALAVLDWRRRFLAEAEAMRQQAELVAQTEQAAKETRETKRRLHRAWLLMSIMAVLVLLCAGLVLWALDSRNDAETAEGAAERNAEIAKANGDLDDVNRLLRTDPAAALALAEDFDLDAEHDPKARFEAAYRKALDAADTDVVLDLGSPVVLAEFDADENLVTITEDGHVRVWTVTEREPMRLDDEPRVDVQVPGQDSARIVQALVADSGRYVVTLSDAGDLASVELASGEVQPFETDLDQVTSIVTGSYGARASVLAGASDGRQVLLDVADHRVVTSPGLQVPLDSAALDVSGTYLAVVTSEDRMVQVWGLKSEKLVAETKLESHTDQTLQYGTVAFTDAPDPVLLVLATGWQTEAAVWDVLNDASPTPLGKDEEGTWRQVYDWTDVYNHLAAEREAYSGLVAVAGDKGVRLFDSRGKSAGEMLTHTVDMNDWATGVEVNPNDTGIFAVASNEGFVELYQQHSFKPPRPLWTFRGHSGTINQLRWSPDGQNLVTASRDGTVRVWRVPATHSLFFASDWILGASFTGDGQSVLGFTPGGYVVRTNAEGADLVSTFVSLYGQIQDMSPSPDGRRAVIAVTYCDPPVRVEVAEDGASTNLDTPEGPLACPTRVAWNPASGSQQIVAGTSDGRIIAWDAGTKKVVGSVTIDPSKAPVLTVDFSGDGETLVATTGGADSAIHVLKASDLSPVRDWPASDVDRLDVSADGSYVATAGNDQHVVRIWDVDDPAEPTQELGQAAGTLGNVTLSQDEGATRVAVATSEGLIYVWERESGRLLAVLKSHSDATNQAVFDPNDIDRIVSAGDDGEMTEIGCEVCSVDAGGLSELAKEREAQSIRLK